MKILVISDTHGGADALAAAISAERAAEVVFHLGDGAWDMDRVRDAFPEKAVLTVRGNCDGGFLADHPESGAVSLASHRVFYCHGHRYAYGGMEDALVYAAKEAGADIALFGHTHAPFFEKRGDVYLCNPGSLCRPRGTAHGTYGLLTLSEAAVDFTVKEFLL